MRQFINQNKWIVIILCILVGIYFLWPIITDSTSTMPDKPVMATHVDSLNDKDSISVTEGHSKVSSTNKTDDLSQEGITRTEEDELTTLQEDGLRAFPQNGDGPEGLLVYITGAVQNPGLYRLPVSSHVHDAIKLAGGLLPYGDGESINLADEIQSGSHIHVRFNFNGNPETLLRTQKININTASEKELDSLPGIGPTMAKRICEYRQTKGTFTSIDDIKHVKGIGDGLYKKIKDKITV